MSDLSYLPQSDSLFFESSTSQLRKWQLKLLSGALILGVVTSIIVLGLSFINPQNPFHSALLIGSIILGFGSAILLLLKNLSFWVRSILCLVFFFIFINTLFFFYGWGVASLVALSGFVAISTTLLFRKSIRYGLIISFLTLVLWAALTFSQSLATLQSPITLSGLFNDGFLVCAMGFFVYFSTYQLKELYLSKIDENQEKVKEILEVNNKYQEILEVLAHQQGQLSNLQVLTSEFAFGGNQEEIISRFVDALSINFSIPYVSVYLVDSGMENIEIVHGSGEIGREIVAQKHHYTTGGSSFISQAILRNQMIVEKVDLNSDLGFSLESSDSNNIALAIPIEQKGKAIGVLLIITEQNALLDENDHLIYRIAANTLTYLISSTNQEKVSPQPEYSFLPSMEKLLVMGETSQFSFPEGAILPDQMKSTASEINIGPSRHSMAKLRVPDRELRQEDLEFLEDLTKHAEKALAHASLVTGLQKTIVSEKKSKEISSRFSGKKNIEDVLKAAITELGKLPEVLDAKVALVASEDAVVTPRLNGRKNDDVA